MSIEIVQSIPVQAETVMVKFEAGWCKPCVAMGPILQSIAEERKDIKIVKIDIDDSPEIASKYGIRSIPCLILFKNGKEVKRQVGLVQKKAILEMLEDDNNKSDLS
jgi:thioredoxin 1